VNARFRLLDFAGSLVWWTGRGLYRAGLALFGWSGVLDALADSYDDRYPLTRAGGSR
jgi:hypothetical protein